MEEVTAIIWFSVDSGASYSILIFVDFGIQESNAGFGISELKFYSGYLLLKKITYQFNLNNKKKISSINLQQNFEIFLI